MTVEIRIRELQGTWVVRAGGAVLGESSSALELSEGDLPPVIYFPRSDLAMAFLEPTDHRTTCPHKGDASYFSIELKSFTLENAAWSYESPKDEVSRIAGHVAFYPRDEIAVEQL
ncbi:Uncharacterized conserved protein, DUF427 family [Poseidonocella pacifica]|uniref:Uncharacterized conserved protein, DUF427 family n=1 Tax=Poseidonocella pacifica TaxID=871651 RepID=A0A1I0VUN3_9RHOB|nr:DUF427 domain-containing protein [Poseidonocella pacifica]SFA80111.1 Uncharacterized conserved protein, DUF427 family [Poseidonocella pacifica]